MAPGKPLTPRRPMEPRKPVAPRKPQPPRHVYHRAESGSGPLDTLCGIKAECGACQYVNLNYAASLATKHKAGQSVLEAAGLLAGTRVLPPVESPRPFGYRSLFKLAVRPAPPSTKPLAEGETPERFAIGLFAQGSHDVVDMRDCPLHAEPLRRLLADLRRELNASALTPFDEATHAGQIRYITARSAHLTDEIMLTFVVTEPLKAELRRLVDLLKRRGHKINSAHMNLNTERGNAIFGAETVRISGNDRLRERLLELDYEVGPTAFFQINPWQASNLYRRLEQIAGPAAGAKGETPVAWDLYCGIGQISLVLARLGYRTLGIEENAEAVQAAEGNARKNHLEAKASFIAARVESAQHLVPVWARAPELIVVNPSRRGLAAETRAELIGLLKAYPRSRFVYVSCEVETLARDLKEVAGATGFHVRQLEAFDMFAQTADMEWLAVMTR